MIKRRDFWLLLLVILVVASGGYYFYRQAATAAVAQNEAEDELQTAVARRGDIVVSAIGAGNIVAAEEVTVGFGSSGTLVELLVQVGDKISTGDVLARIDDADAQQSLVNAQLQYQRAAMQTDASVTATGVSYDDISIAQQEINLAEAQAALDELRNWEPDADEIALAEANLAAAEASYNSALGQAAASNASITISNISVEQAERSLADAQSAYDVAWDPGRDWELGDPRMATALENERERTADALLRAQESLQIAQLNYSATVSTSGSSSVANAQTSLLNAQLALEAAKSGPDEDEIEAMETAVHQAELSLQQALLNREANELSLAQAAIDLQNAEEAVAATELIAPMDGTVIAINGAVGEVVSGNLLVLADLSQPVLELFLDESDLNMVGVGYEVEIIFDALPDELFSGSVAQIDPVLQMESGLTVIHALVALDDFAKPQILPVGLNASVEVIGGRAENAVLVPVEALREISPGQYAIFVMENGEPVLRFVDVGIMDFSFAEILSGVEAGEEVTTGILQTQSE